MIDKLLRLGVDKVVINSAAVRNPSLRKISQNLVLQLLASIETAKITRTMKFLLKL